MKQSITVKQASQLSNNDTLGKWCADKGYERTLSIGQMIEFIQEHKDLKGISKNRFGKWFVNIDTAQLGYKDELCDALWEAITQIVKSMD